MKKASVIIAVFAVSILLFVFLRHKNWPQKITASPVQEKSGHAAQDQSPHVAMLDMTGYDREDNAKVFKPKSLRVEEGAATVLEIDHGLPEQLVDTKEMRKGVDHGLLGAITLRVVDSTGNVVQGATVKGAFWNPGAVKDRRFNIETDGRGEVHLENKSAGDLNFSITKDGYYDSTFRYWFFKNGYDCAKDGRWIPWNPTVEVTLKEKRNPAALLYKTFESRVPVYNESIGFDFEKADWVSPYGKGTHSDVSMTYSEAEDTGDVDLYALTWECAGPAGGAYLRPTDSYSQLLSDYVAAFDGYQPVLHFNYERTDDKIFKDTGMKEGEMLVFRIRTQMDGTGNLQSAQYGKLYGPLKFADGPRRFIRFAYYLNPVPNDPNLESLGLYP